MQKSKKLIKGNKMLHKVINYTQRPIKGHEKLIFKIITTSDPELMGHPSIWISSITIYDQFLQNAVDKGLNYFEIYC